MLFQLTYCSESLLLPGAGLQEVRRIHDSAMRNNVANGITGVLIFTDSWFLQVLEGERQAVSSTLVRIAQDDRHDRLCIVQANEVQQRRFANWSMNLVRREPATITAFAKAGLSAGVALSELTSADVALIVEQMVEHQIRPCDGFIPHDSAALNRPRIAS